jgi:hypothetical protein
MRRGMSNEVVVSNTIPIIIKGADIVAQALVVPAMPFVLLALLQKIAVQLLHIILDERNI